MLAIIPARGGSKGLPGKNILPLNGKPLIAYTIEAALAAKSVSKTIVDTDCPKIAEVAKRFGADVPYLRPAELASDTAGTREVVLYALDRLRDIGEFWTTFAIFQATSPFRTSEHIDEAAALLLADGVDAVISVTPFKHPVEWAVNMGPKGELSPRESMPEQRQKASTAYHPNGAIYMFDTEFYRSCPSVFGKTTRGYVMSHEWSIDIDTPWDMQLASLTFRLREKCFEKQA